ncbi:hypothetical protein [Mailhella sp.]|uniref:hypothetical protein n=1 Tax=Mailhella sp. TaxID=1981029 RepID=UPI003AB27519
MIFLPRFFLLLALTLAAIPSAGWLILVCADFLSLEDCLAPQPGWTAFALISALSLAIPPALHGWPDHTRPASVVARETARAMLLSLALFAVFFLLCARPLLQWLRVPELMLPTAALFLAPLLSCPAQYVSYKIAVVLLPRPEPSDPRPHSIQAFGALSLLLLFILVFHGFVLSGDHASPIIHAGRQSVIAAAWRFLALRYVIAVRGDAGFAPAWGGCCLISVLDMARVLPNAGTAELAIMALLFLIMLTSSICLLLPSSRRWLC